MKKLPVPARLIGNIAEQWARGDRVSLVSLIAANLLPVFFALVFGWDLGGVVMFYWWENIIIGLYAIVIADGCISVGTRTVGQSRDLFFPALHSAGGV